MPAGWGIVEYRGRAAFEPPRGRREQRLYAAMPLRTGSTSYETHRAYSICLMAAPDRFKMPRADGRPESESHLPTRGEAWTASSVPSIPVWGCALATPHVLVADIHLP